FSIQEISIEKERFLAYLRIKSKEASRIGTLGKPMFAAPPFALFTPPGKVFPAATRKGLTPKTVFPKRTPRRERE
ncbi:MAG: hypothetical protein R6Y91_02435, partial [Desulfohalobium sp.]